VSRPGDGARERILARLHAALRGAPDAAEPPREYLTAGGTGDLVALFADRLRDYGATVYQGTDIAALVARALTRDRHVAVPPGLPRPWLAGYPGRVLTEPLSVGDLDGTDAVLTGCALAVAGTGTIVLDGGPGQGRRALSLVPDHHVCVVRTGQLVGTVPEAVRRVAPRRPLTWISGPSATSDIELNRVAGVHGPRRLDVIVLDG